MSFTSEKWLAIGTGDGTGTGVPNDPFVVNTPEWFAKRIRENTNPGDLIRLGPGIFRTRGVPQNGFDDRIDVGQKIFNLKSGQKLIGAGRFATTLQFVWDFDPPTETNYAYQPGQRAVMITGAADTYLKSSSVEDLTLDCNLGHVPEPFVATTSSTGWTEGVGNTTVKTATSFFTGDMVGCTIGFSNGFSARIMGVTSGIQATMSSGQAISQPGLSFTLYGLRLSVTTTSLTGDNVRLLRIRLINFGTRTPAAFDGLSMPDRSYEAFPARIEGRSVNRASGDIPAFNSWIENCIIEQPYPSPGREVTAAVASGGIAAAARPNLGGTRLHLQPFGCGIRNCYMDFDYINPLPGNPLSLDGSTIVYGGAPNVTVTTPLPHRLYPGDYVEFTGGGVSALNNKRFKVESIASGAEPKWAERIFKLNISPQPSQPSGAMTVFSSPLQTMLISSMSSDGTKIGVTTAAKHKRVENDIVVISGAEPDGYNGTFKVGASPTDTTFTCTPVSGSVPSAGSASGIMWLDRRPNRFVRITSISGPDANRIATVTTDGPHYKIPGDWLMINAVKTTSSPDLDKLNNSFNNYVEVTAITGRTTLEVRLPGATNVSGLDLASSNDPGIVTNFQATSVNGGLGGGLYSNRIANATRGGTYHDFYWEVQFLARRNYYSNVYAGPLMTFGTKSTYRYGDPEVSTDFRWGTVKNVNGNLVKMELDVSGADPAYVPGLALRVSVGHNQLPAPDPTAYDVEILSAQMNSGTNKYEITFLQPSAIFSTAGSTSLITADLWFQQSLFLFEDNVLDLATEPTGGTGTPPTGVWFIGPYTGSPPRGLNNGAKYPWVLQSAIVRDNHIRKFLGALDPLADLTLAISITSSRDIIAEGNIFPLMNSGFTYYDKANIFRYSDSKNLKAFNNQTPTGKLWQFYNDPRWLNNTDYSLDEIETAAEDMLWVWSNRTRLFKKTF